MIIRNILLDVSMVITMPLYHIVKSLRLILYRISLYISFTLGTLYRIIDDSMKMASDLLHEPPPRYQVTRYYMTGKGRGYRQGDQDLLSGTLKVQK